MCGIIIYIERGKMLRSISDITDNLAIAPDEVIEITRKKKVRESYPGFTIFGNGKETRNGGKSMDIIEVFKQLNTGEMCLLQFFRDEIEVSKILGEDNPNKVVPARSEKITPYLKIALKKNFPHMECLGIIKRIKRGTYMLNPSLFIPPKEPGKLRTVWDNIDSKCVSQDKEVS